MHFRAALQRLLRYSRRRCSWWWSRSYCAESRRLWLPLGALWRTTTPRSDVWTATTAGCHGDPCARARDSVTQGTALACRWLSWWWVCSVAFQIQKDRRRRRRSVAVQCHVSVLTHPPRSGSGLCRMKMSKKTCSNQLHVPDTRAPKSASHQQTYRSTIIFIGICSPFSWNYMLQQIEQRLVS